MVVVSFLDTARAFYPDFLRHVAATNLRQANGHTAVRTVRSIEAAGFARRFAFRLCF
jgi:hypothetical protein